MDGQDIYLAVFIGNQDSARREAWNAMSDDERNAKQQQGMSAWQEWMQKHGEAVVDGGGPLGKTKRVSREGVADVSNDLTVFMTVRAPSHEAAARMFESHPHFTVFPGEAIEVMPLLPIPGA